MKQKVDKTVFDAVKAMTTGGATISDCGKFTGLAHATISRIRAVESFAQYLQTPVRKNKKAVAEQPEAVEHRQTVIVQASHYMLKEQQKTNELLTAISNKLAFIVDELCGTKEG